MSDASRIIQIIKQAATETIENSKPVAVLFGTVQSIAPLTIFVDQKTILEEEEIILIDNVRDYKTQISFDNPNIENNVTIGKRPIPKNGVLTTEPDTGQENSKAAIFEGKLSFMEKVKHDVTVYNALKVGEKVLILRVQGGQRFIILNRVVI